MASGAAPAIIGFQLAQAPLPGTEQVNAPYQNRGAETERIYQNRRAELRIPGLRERKSGNSVIICPVHFLWGGWGFGEAKK